MVQKEARLGTGEKGWAGFLSKSHWRGFLEWEPERR